MGGILWRIGESRDLPLDHSDGISGESRCGVRQIGVASGDKVKNCTDERGGSRLDSVKRKSSVWLVTRLYQSGQVPR